MYLFNLPGMKTYNSKINQFLSFDVIERHLGATFFPRVNNIYLNLLMGIVIKDYQYLSSIIANPKVYEKIIKQRQAATQSQFRIQMSKDGLKINKPNKKYEKYAKFLRLRETIWENDSTRIGVACNVHFGHKFQSTQLNPYQISKYRYLHYNPQLKITDNLRNMYNHQTYQFLIKISSKVCLEAYDVMNSLHKEEGEVMTEIVMRTGNQKFNWVISDINGLSSQ